MPGLLGDVVRATAAAADRDDLLRRVAAVLVGRVDWVLADGLDEPDLVTRVAALGPDGPLPLPPGLDGPASRRSSAGSVGLLPVLRATPGRVLRLGAADLARGAASDDPHLSSQAAAALALGAEDLLLLGLAARDTLLGVLVLGSRSRLDPGLLDELADVAAHVGTALDAVRLLAAQRAVATAMQTSLLPPLPRVPGLALAARYAPAAHELDVGGDWYDAFPTPSGLVVVVGDVRGHDLAAAAQMADLRNLLRAHAVDRDEPPAALLDRLERTTTALGLGVAATCVLGVVRPVEGGWSLTWSSAGHLPPLHVSDGRARLLETEPELMLGVQAGSGRSDHTALLRPGDTLVLCTDGLVEVRGAPLDARLEVLRALAEDCAGSSPDRLAEQLLGLVTGAEDDVALLVVRVLGR